MFTHWSDWIEAKQYVIKDLCYFPNNTYSQTRPQVSTFSNIAFLPFRRHILRGEDPIVHTNDKFRKGQVNQCYGFCIDTDWISKKQWILPTPPLNVQWQKLISLHVRKTETVLDSGFHSLDSGFFASGTWIRNCISLVGFRIPLAEFRIPKWRIPDYFTKRLIPYANYNHIYFTDSSPTSWIEGKKPWNLSLGPDMSPSHFCAWRISLLTGKSLKQYIHLSSNSVVNDWLPDKTPSREPSCKRQHGIEIQ